MIKTYHIFTLEQSIDIFTKFLSFPQFSSLLSKLGIINIYSSLRENVKELEIQPKTTNTPTGNSHQQISEKEQIKSVAKEFNFQGSSASDTSCRVSDIPIAAFGSRAHLEEKRKWYCNFLMKGFHLVVILDAGSGIRDTQMFTRAAARNLFTNVRLKRWCFDVELVFLCKWFSIQMLEISVNWSEIPGSKVNQLSIPNLL